MKEDLIVNENLERIFNELLNDAIRQKKEVALETGGRCMEPFLKEGDRISFKKSDLNKLKWLDLIVFKKKNSFISHRFIKTVRKNNQIYIISKTDISGKYDDPIREEDFIGLITTIGKPDKIIYLNTLEGRLRSYLNILIAPLYLFISKIKSKQGKNYLEKENELLILFSKIDIDKNVIDRIKEILSGNLNWGYISEMTKQNFIAPFMSKNIISCELKNQVPEEIQENVRQISAWQISRDKRLSLELKNILGIFKRNNIKVMVIKGAHLSEEVYADTFLRWMGDIDILAKIDDWSKIKDTLQQMGFRFYDADYDSWRLTHLDYHTTFFKNDLKLEVKFNLWLMDFPYFKNDIWENVREIVLREEKAYVPSLEDTLLIACANLARHNYSGLIWFCDIREIVERFRDKINWDTVIRRAQEKDIDCLVYYALYYSSRLLKFEVPEDILQKFKISFIKRQLHKFFWDGKIILWQKAGYPPRARMVFEIVALLFCGKISFKPRKLLKMLIYITSVIMPNRVSLSWRYGIDRDSPKLIFYYLLQPLRFFSMLLNNLMTVIRGN